jgi:hypothetical protein
VTEACPEKLKEAEVDVFEESLDKMEATQEATETVVERQELRIEEAEVDTIGTLEYRYGYQHLVARRHQH